MSTRNDVLMALLAQLQTILDASLEAVTVKNVIFYDSKKLKPGQYESPTIVLNDPGPEEVLVRDRFAIRNGTDVVVTAEVRNLSGEQMSAMLNDIIAQVESIIEASPDLGVQCLGTQWKGLENIVYDSDEARAWAWMNIRLIYVCTRGAY